MSVVYSNLKVFQYPDRIEAVKKNKLVAPVHIRIKPFNHCNHDCWYCAYRVSNLQLGEDMDTRDVLPKAKMYEIIDDVIEMGVQAVTFSGGGEPTLYKPLPDVIEKLGKGGIRVGCLSNGSNLKGKMADAFAEYGTWVRISIDGWDDASYAKARNVKIGTFTTLIKNMREFVKRKSNCTLGVSFIVDENNHSHVFEACKLFKSIGVNHVKLSGVVIGNSAVENNEYHRKFAAKITEEIEKAETLSDENFRILNHYHALEERFNRPYTKCPNIQLNPVIGADEFVYTCHDKAFTEGGKLGSISEKSFKEFWYSEENREKVYAVNPSKHCLHHCADNNKNITITEFISLDPDHGRFV